MQKYWYFFLHRSGFFKKKRIIPNAPLHGVMGPGPRKSDFPRFIFFRGRLGPDPPIAHAQYSGNH